MTQLNAPSTAIAPRFICRCEEIAEQEVRQAIADGARTLNDVKRRTRVGMGPCQGIFCVRPLADLLREAAGMPEDAIVPMTARPPVRLLPLGLLAETEE
jgi:bacterioferritin-associated ferredoxin